MKKPDFVSKKEHKELVEEFFSSLRDNEDMAARQNEREREAVINKLKINDNIKNKLGEEPKPLESCDTDTEMPPEYYEDLKNKSSDYEEEEEEDYNDEDSIDDGGPISELD